MNEEKNSKTILLLTLLFLLIGLASATSISNDTSTHDNTEKITPNTVKTVESSEQIVEKKTIKKENKNKSVKTASKTIDASDFDTLHNTLTSDEYDTLTINIKSDITLTNNTELNKAIKTLTINGNQKTINGNNKYQFLYIESDSKVTVKYIKINNCYNTLTEEQYIMVET